MTQSLAITDYIDSLAEAETRFGLSHSADPDFFTEWSADLPPLTLAERQRLDLIKQRYLYHRQYGHLLEGGVNFIVIAPLLELAGFYDSPFRLRSEASIRIEIADEDDTVYQGRIDSLIVQEHLWIVLVEAKRTSFSIDVALPQALAYMAADLDRDRPTYGLVSNGAYSMFVKLDQAQYGFSDDFSLNRQRNELYGVLKILNYLKTLA
ncbi:type I restriction endonuclease subunit R [Leptolyngbya sp. CCNP1308]|uniref:type I restriction endonuclease subunit R n=1 Tax=Leptolyngbya sp. CCNP1308 TaxID=3110255 RepID=UPI002B220C08|nr:type I restriction endonuclease subunit R [Leptolyngbya sp. CCNP1308]MEA5453067.1 type I restriction endonuclease subunit R [Leptolyngbya sp. CCNP1308]